MEILDGVLSKYDKTENYNMDEIHTPWGKIQTVHGWPSNYVKYKLGFDEKAIQYYEKMIDGKFLICFSPRVMEYKTSKELRKPQRPTALYVTTCVFKRYNDLRSTS